MYWTVVAAQVLADGGVERAEFGQRVFVLRAIAFVAVRFFVLGRMIAGRDLVEREHRHEMFDAGKFFAGRAADPLRGRFGRDEVGKIFLQFLQFAEKLVVFVVGDELPAFDVISVVVPADFVGELGVAFFGFGLCHAEMMCAGEAKENPFWLAVNPISTRRVFFAGPDANPARDAQPHPVCQIGS